MLTHYMASKMGVIGFTRALATDVAAFGITVNAVGLNAVPHSRRRVGNATGRTRGSRADAGHQTSR